MNTEQNGSPDIFLPMTGSGYLTVRTSTARGAIPVSDAEIHISKARDKANSGIIVSVVTNADGQTEKIELPAPPRAASEAPSSNGMLPYALYNIDAYKEGFYTQRYYDVPIFDGITSFQTIDLIPLPESGRDPAVSYEEENISENVAPDL